MKEYLRLVVLFYTTCMTCMLNHYEENRFLSDCVLFYYQVVCGQSVEYTTKVGKKEKYLERSAT